MDIRELTPAEWARALPDSGYEVFHRPEALTVIEEFAPGYELSLYGGYKGDQVVALLPLFIKNYPLGSKIITSPPPGMHIPHLGPILMPTSPKQRKAEQVNNQFTQAILEELDLNSRSLFYMICSPEYADPRPFTWADHEVNVSFTYNVNVDEQAPDDVIKMFSRSQRREIRKSKDLDVSVVIGDIDDAREVYDQTQDRFSEQNEYFGVSWPLVRTLYNNLDDHVRVYVARGPNEEPLSGIICLYSNDAASYWLGGVRFDYKNISLNTLLHWAIIRDIAEDPTLDSITKYDMVGAGEYRLSKYKSKFNPELRRYYVVDSGGTKMRFVKAAYGVFQGIPTALRNTLPSLRNPIPRPRSILPNPSSVDEEEPGG